MKHWPAYLNKLGTGLDAVWFSLLVEEETAIRRRQIRRKRSKIKFDNAVSLFKECKTDPLLV